MEYFGFKGLGGSTVVRELMSHSLFLSVPLSERVVIHRAHLIEHHELLSVWMQSETTDQVFTVKLA